MKKDITHYTNERCTPGNPQVDFNALAFTPGQVLIGLAGPARSGKDTAAGILAARYGFATFAFAAALKEALCIMCDLHPDMLDGDLKEKPIKRLGGKSPREMLQTLGTEWGRETICDDIWIEKFRVRWMRENLARSPGLLVTDVRFENEAEAIRAEGGVIWHVARPDAPGVAEHKSEAGVRIRGDLGDVTLVNGGSIGDWQRTVEYALLYAPRIEMM